MKLFYIYIMLLITQVLYAQTEEFNFYFERLDNTVGLPSNEIRRIHQDSEGFMWFGARNGLIRYDGYKYVVYRNSIAYPNLLTHNAIMSFAEDENFIWIGSERGLNRWEKQTRDIVKIDQNEINNARNQ